MRTRLDLQRKLESIQFVRQVLFNGPESCKRLYPGIEYALSTRKMSYADNIRYRDLNCWKITIMDTDPESKIPKLFEELFEKYWSFDVTYPTENLTVWVYTLFY